MGLTLSDRQNRIWLVERFHVKKADNRGQHSTGNPEDVGCGPVSVPTVENLADMLALDRVSDGFLLIAVARELDLILLQPTDLFTQSGGLLGVSLVLILNLACGLQVGG